MKKADMLETFWKSTRKFTKKTCRRTGGHSLDGKIELNVLFDNALQQLSGKFPRNMCFKIDASRGSKVLYDTLGDDFLGSISSDFYSAYRKYTRETGVLVGCVNN